MAFSAHCLNTHSQALARELACFYSSSWPCLGGNPGVFGVLRAFTPHPRPVWSL